MRNRDLVVIARLGLVVGDKVTWAEVKVRIRSSVSPEDLERICARTASGCHRATARLGLSSCETKSIIDRVLLFLV